MAVAYNYTFRCKKRGNQRQTDIFSASVFFSPLATRHSSLATAVKSLGVRSAAAATHRGGCGAHGSAGPSQLGGNVLHVRRELAGGEGLEGAQALVEFGGGQAAFTVERAEKVGGGAFSFQRIAFQTAGNQVTVGVASRLCAGHDMIEAPDAPVAAPQAIKTVAALARVDRLA